MKLGAKRPLSSQQPQAALKLEARRDCLKLGSRRLPLKLETRSRSDPNDLSKEQVAQSLALLLARLVGRMADGDEGNGGVALGSGESRLQRFGVVVANPASA